MGATSGADAASWMVKLLHGGVPVRAPATLPDSSSLPSTNWQVLVCKGRFWAGGTDRRMGNLCVMTVSQATCTGVQREWLSGMCKKGPLWPAKPRDSGQMLKQAVTGFQGVHIGLSSYPAHSNPDNTCWEVSLGGTTSHPDLKALTLDPVTQSEYMPSRVTQDRTSPVIPGSASLSCLGNPKGRGNINSRVLRESTREGMRNFLEGGTFFTSCSATWHPGMAIPITSRHRGSEKNWEKDLKAWVGGLHFWH